ncbi:hypothetical protein KP509_21G018900 [Ceratopteris richardii]|nr:hypothetical protein KP509_21G018900 [Ceratopteris richardii]
MVGSHQLNNATTAICAILCLRDQGWIVEDDAIWSGLKNTHAIGRFQVMSKAASMKTGCNPSTIVLDGAHTGTSAKVLVSTLKMVFSSEPLALVVAMASDKDHVEFCAQLLAGAAPRVVVVTEVMVAGCRLRSTPACVLADCLNQAAKLQNKKVIHEHANDEIKDSELDSYIIVAESDSIVSGIKKASELLHHVGQKGAICVTGSLHAVSEVLSYLMTN